MLYLVTGQPGAGKTQYVLGQLLEQKRPVYFYNVAFDFVPKGWHEYDPREWEKLPPESVLLVDEAQDVMGIGKLRAEQWITNLAKHRHRGIDVWLITQHPTLIHNLPRRLAGEWRNCVRIFGRNACMVTSRNRADDDAPAQWSRPYVYDRSVWALYKSAEAHTKHGSFPVKYAVVIFAALGLGGWAIWSAVHSKFLLADAKAAAPVVASAPAQRDAVAVPASGGGKRVEPRGDTCPIVVGSIEMGTRRLLLFEDATGAIVRVAAPLDIPDDWSWRGCRYYFAAGSLVSLDAGQDAVKRQLERAEARDRIAELETKDARDREEKTRLARDEIERERKRFAEAVPVVVGTPDKKVAIDPTKQQRGGIVSVQRAVGAPTK